VEAGKLHGFNTDGRGFARAIREVFSVDLRDLRVMILGAGGAARAIALQCAKENSERLVITNRSLEKAQKLADQLRDFFAGPKVLGPVPRLQAVPLEEAAIRFQIANVDLVVNATPVGLNRGDPSPIAARLLAPHVMVYDTIYSVERTAFVSAAVRATFSLPPGPQPRRDLFGLPVLPGRRPIAPFLYHPPQALRLPCKQKQARFHSIQSQRRSVFLRLRRSRRLRQKSLWQD